MKYALTYISWLKWDSFMIHIHPWDDHRHFPRAFKSEYICFLEEREINRNLKQK